ncbi:hypothetical protein VIBR0546_16486 [Vibrio brasiliensis LMG 20546]|uniref:Uncharacterized protein n=2 Tax=Vibrio brasiliensis TaxID=170652 RepID=E8M057_9VIBR|nr:hypothetical protein VIBR0546_16486 [Vibrio brasiliensis LMG 20546]
MVLNRLLFVLFGVICLVRHLITCQFKVRIDLNFLFLPIFVMYSLIVSIFFRSDGILAYIKEVALFVSVFSLILYCFTSYIPPLVPRLFCVIASAFSLDAVFQSIYGTNIFGFSEPFMGRHWGVFHYGAPTLGIYLSLIFFVPMYVLKSRILAVLTMSIFALGILVSNDRAALMIVFSSFLIYMLIQGGGKRILYLIALTMLIVILSAVLYDYLPYRIQWLVGFIKEVLVSDNISPEMLDRFSVSAYVDIWTTNIRIWFDQDNLFFVFFGSGFGNLQYFLVSEGGYERTHSFLLEILMTFGVFGNVFILIMLKGIIRNYNSGAIMILSYFTPFFFFSLYSANTLFMLIFSFYSYAYYRTQLGENYD